MKYLKRYEKMQEKTLSIITDWMRNNKIEKLFFEPNGLKTYDEIVLGIGFENNILKCYWKYVNDELIWKNKLSVFYSELQKRILNYLNNLTTDDIEILQSKQESEKFNF